MAAAIAPDDAEGLKNAAVDCVSDATFCAAVGGWSLSIFHHQWRPMKRELAVLATRNILNFA
jgi:hypothetical protein